MQFLKNLVFPGGFMSHGYCRLRTPSLIGLHVVSDSLIALSYLSIPIIRAHQIHETVHTLAPCLFLVKQASPRRATANRTEKSA